MTFFLVLFLIISLAVNVVAIMYIRHVFNKLMFDAESLEFVKNSLEGFEEHLNALMRLNVMQDDAHVKSLISHVKDVIQDIRIFKYIYELIDDKDLELPKEEEYDEDEAFIELNEEGHEKIQDDRKTIYG